MKTINTILPIYDSLEKQDKNRTGTQMPILTPRYRLPAFQWKDDTDGATTISNIELIDKKGHSKGIDIGFTYWNSHPDHGKWTTFLSTGLDITYAHTTQIFTSATLMPVLKVVGGDIITIKYNYNAPAGTNVTLVVDISGGDSSLLIQGYNTISYTVDSSVLYHANLNIYLSLNAATFSLTDVSVEIKSFKDIFPTLPAAHAVGTDVYFQYKGDTLNYLLPRGEYYLKITTNTAYSYFSEWFVVTDIYDNLIHTLTKINGYGVLTLYKTSVLQAISAGVSVNSIDSNTFNVKNAETITVIVFLEWISGEMPAIFLANDAGSVSSSVSLSAGINVITLTAQNSELVRLRIINTNSSNWNTSEILVIRNYSTDFTKITFTDTHDLGDILYHDGFVNTCFLEAKLNNPTHEVVEVGEEKNGIFITEKLVTKYKYKIIANVSRQLYSILMRLPQHDSITITDEVGNVYTPKVGNIWVSAPNWIFYDVCRIEIQFNDNSEFVWTSENNNLT